MGTSPKKHESSFSCDMGSFEAYREFDVLSGRGSSINSHSGNLYFRDVVNHHRRTYLNSKWQMRRVIAKAIVADIRSKGGRFLKQIDGNGLWCEIGERGAIDKTTQALRQMKMRRKLIIEDEQAQLEKVIRPLPVAAYYHASLGSLAAIAQQTNPHSMAFTNLLNSSAYMNNLHLAAHTLPFNHLGHLTQQENKKLSASVGQYSFCALSQSASPTVNLRGIGSTDNPSKPSTFIWWPSWKQYFIPYIIYGIHVDQRCCYCIAAVFSLCSASNCFDISDELSHARCRWESLKPQTCDPPSNLPDIERDIESETSCIHPSLLIDTTDAVLLTSSEIFLQCLLQLPKPHQPFQSLRRQTETFKPTDRLLHPSFNTFVYRGHERLDNVDPNNVSIIVGWADFVF